MSQSPYILYLNSKTICVDNYLGILIPTPSWNVRYIQYYYFCRHAIAAIHFNAVNGNETPNTSPMNAMLDKQPRDKAVEKRKARDTMTLEDVPPTNPGTMQSSYNNSAI